MGTENQELEVTGAKAPKAGIRVVVFPGQERAFGEMLAGHAVPSRRTCQTEWILHVRQLPVWVALASNRGVVKSVHLRAQTVEQALNPLLKARSFYKKNKPKKGLDK